MRIIAIIIKRQLADTLKNKAVLIQFVMFPIMAIVMTLAIKIDGMPENFFVDLFASMYIGMAPLTSMSAIISEEKEKNTLRVLFLSDVSPAQYLLGVGGYIWIICMAGAAVFCATGKYAGSEALCFMAVMAVGILCSIVIGAVIGTWGKNQMAATSITVPVMIVFSFLPMFSMFNETIKKVARLTYSEQVNLLINELDLSKVTAENIIVIAVNIAAAVFAFHLAYRKSGLV